MRGRPVVGDGRLRGLGRLGCSGSGWRVSEGRAGCSVIDVNCVAVRVVVEELFRQLLVLLDDARAEREREKRGKSCCEQHVLRLHARSMLKSRLPVASQASFLFSRLHQ